MGRPVLAPIEQSMNKLCPMPGCRVEHIIQASPGPLHVIAALSGFRRGARVGGGEPPASCHATDRVVPGGERLGAEQAVAGGGDEVAGGGKALATAACRARKRCVESGRRKPPSTARQRYMRRPPTDTNTSSRCHAPFDLRPRCARSPRAIVGPKRATQARTVS